jgi:cell volume regulation protein A
VAFVAQVVLFVLLGLLVFPHQLPAVALPGLALAFLLMLVARPAAVWASTATFAFTNRDRVLLGWAGLRGAVPIVLATFVLTSDVSHNQTIFNAVFFVVVVSTLVQNTTLERVAERLGVTTVVATPEAGAVVSPASAFDVTEFIVEEDHAINGSAVRELGLPREAVLAAINRNGDTMALPQEDMIVEAGDRLSIVVPGRRRPDLEDVFTRWRRMI